MLGQIGQVYKERCTKIALARGGGARYNAAHALRAAIFAGRGDAMPVYTYRCEACGFTFDQRLRFNDPPPTRCPECGAEAVRRVYKPVGIVFKGSGFYATDHRSPSGTGGNGKATSEGALSSEPAAAKTPAAEAPSAKAKKAKPAESKAPAAKNAS